MHNFSSRHGRAPLCPIVTSRIGQKVALDYMGPFKETRNGNRCIIIGVDAHSKFILGAATMSFDAVTSAGFFCNEVICKYGMVEEVLTDQGV